MVLFTVVVVILFALGGLVRGGEFAAVDLARTSADEDFVCADADTLDMVF